MIFIKAFRKFVFFLVNLFQSGSKKGRNYQAFTRSVIHKAHSGRNISIDSKFLGAPNGVFSIWAYVNNSHNERTSYYKFIVSYNSIGEKKIDPSKYESYPDTWAILRETPSKQDDFGKWKFVCRNVINKITSIECTEPLTNGWHLFTVAWSKKSNYIKFIIDTNLIGETKFINWPTEFSQNIRIGRISRDNTFSYFNSKIEPSRFTPDEYKKKYVNEFFRKQPSE